MGDRPYTLLSCSVSLDGYLDRAGGDRLVLSNAADLDRVDEVRAGCDAIMVGAATIRRDDPRLLVRSATRQASRTALGMTPSPTRVTVTERADLDAAAAFFTCGAGTRLVYCASPKVDDALTRLGRLATVVDAGHPVEMQWVLEDLATRGVRRLMVEGGGTVHTQLLTAGLADELQLVVAPIFVGDSRAVRFVGDGAFPWQDGQRARLVETRPVGDVVLLRYALSDRYDAAGVTS